MRCVRMYKCLRHTELFVSLVDEAFKRGRRLFEGGVYSKQYGMLIDTPSCNGTEPNVHHAPLSVEQLMRCRDLALLYTTICLLGPRSSCTTSYLQITTQLTHYTPNISSGLPHNPCINFDLCHALVASPEVSRLQVTLPRAREREAMPRLLRTRWQLN